MIYRFKDEYKAKGEEIGAKDPSSLVAMLLYWPMTEEEYNLLPDHVKECCIGLDFPENRQVLEGMLAYITNNRGRRAMEALLKNGEKKIDPVYTVYDTTRILSKYERACNHKCTGVGQRIPRDYPTSTCKHMTYIDDFEDYSEALQKTSLYKEIKGICSLVKDDKAFFEFGTKFNNLILRERFYKEVLEQLNEVIPSPAQQC